MRCLRRWSATVLGVALTVCGPATANVRLPALFSQGMVLQRTVPAVVWGWAEPGEQIAVLFSENKVTVSADAQGRWKISLGILQAGGPFEMTVSGTNTLTIKDIYVGEVWLCAGQSNMENTLSREQAAGADFPQIRVFRVELAPRDEPQAEAAGRWTICTPREAAQFSAVAYYFGRDLHAALKVPIGLVVSAKNGSVIEGWMSREALLSDPDFRPIVERAEAQKIKWTQDMLKLSQQLGPWLAEAEKDRAAGKAIQPMPVVPAYIRTPFDYPDNAVSYLYNGMIAPLIPLSVRGIAWYQGEANEARAAQYRKLFPTLIQSWRKSWGLGELPFLFVQLPNYSGIKEQPVESSVAELREAQAKALSLPKTAMTVTADIGDGDLHPANKQDFGARLALSARAVAYGENVAYLGPTFESLEANGNQITLHFKDTGGRLQTKSGEPLKYIAIAGTDRKFVWAECKIKGETLIVSSESVPNPVAVRYAWADNPMHCNLYNAAGLPAAPFRTDTWPGRTENVR